MDLDQDRSKALAGFSQKLKESAAAKFAATQQQPTEAQGAPQIQVINPPVSLAVPTQPSPAVVAPPTEQTPPAAAEKPKEEPVAQPAAQPAPTAAPEPPPQPLADDYVKPWDEDLLQQTTDVPLTLEDLGSALKLPTPLKKTSELVAEFNKYKARVEELEKTPDTSLDFLDDDLKDLVSVAKNKGDWKKHLSTKVVDYSKVDPVLFFNNSVEQDPQYRTPQGQIDFARVDETLAAIPHEVKIAEGNRMLQLRKSEQEQLRRNIQVEADRRQTEFNRNLAEAARKLPETLSKEKYGIQVGPQHADYFYEGIRNGKLIEKHLGKIDVSGVDPTKLLNTLVRAELAERISKTQYDQGVVQGKKALLKSVQNVQLNTPSIAPEPNVKSTTPVTAADKTKAFLDKNRVAGNSL